ncbi:MULTISPECIES: potassium channel family protein [Pseudanabaena]|uniref:TrkA-N domain protein n=2 Tax=Pseudanabaena TaxID=1152 RepID=L8MWU2_9CYAN|nr:MULTISPECIES: NAD-binding protein [Pseudanabaena]ELS32462.1 TrkA-N domain protein [Pseudanabaena biceps PCC 7429]MDG3495319.1 NAD-binding protein [Pseudanabaena catenata USMAC16]
MRSLAALIKNCLLDLEIKVNVTIRQKRQEIHILLESTYFGDRQSLVGAIANCLSDIDNRLESAKIYAFLFGQPLPLWIEKIVLSQDQISVASEETKTQPENPRIYAGTALVSSNEITIADRFIVCGLGSLGQHTVFNLKKFSYREYEVKIRAIDKVKPELMEFDNFHEFLDEPIILGDCRRSEVLIKAGIADCRAILLVTSNDNVNIETAIAVRRLNPHIHIVVRSSRQNLNQLLKEQLGNFVALDPVDLPAAAFAVAGLGEDTLGLFQLGVHKLRVVNYTVEPNDYQFLRIPAFQLHKKHSRLLSLAEPQSDRLFFQWQPDRTIQVGDEIVCIEYVEHDFPTIHRHPELIDLSSYPNISISQKINLQLRKFISSAFWTSQWKQIVSWFQAEKSRRLVLWGAITAISLLTLSSVILFFNVPNISWQKAISTSIILLLGGYGDVFGGLGGEDQVPLWLMLFCVLITLISLLFVLGVVGLVTDKILSSKFEFFKRSLPLPKKDHIILIGFGRLGQRIADLLFKLKLPFVIVSENPHDCDLADKVPWLTGNIIEELSKTNLATAKSMLSVTDDQMLNLEAALFARDAAKKNNRQMNLAIRTYDRYFSDNLSELLPKSQSLCAYALSAEAFAGAAFGETMLSLFRLNQRTVLVAEYVISENDTLIGKNLSQIAYGYTVVPVYLKTQQPKADGHYEFYMPSDDEVMKAGDRLTVLASISGLRRIELGNLHSPKQWQLRAKRPLNSSVLLDAGNKLKNISGCDLEVARRFMQSLPAAIELPMYDTQAYRLGQALMRLLPIKIYPL